MKTIDKCEKANFIHAVQKGRVGTNEDRDVIDAELRNNLLLYGDNLLGRVGMNGNLGQMVLELLPRCAREGLVRRFAKCDEDKNPELLDQVMSSIGEPEKLQAAIDEAIKKTGCPVTRTQMERMMIDSFEESFSGSLLRNAYAPKLEQLKKTFGLNGTEAELVCLLVLRPWVQPPRLADINGPRESIRGSCGRGDRT